jgi:hypothetical protein
MLDLVDPVGYPPVHAQAKRRVMDTPVGRRVGFIWNQYQTTKGFWLLMEEALQKVCSPSAVRRAYKGNTWSPLDKTQFDELAGSVDYLVVGVGA